MLTSRRDFFLRIVDEVSLLLQRSLQQRTTDRPAEALLSVVAGCERLFQLEAPRLFQLSADQQFSALAAGETAEVARDKILLYAALNQEAARCYRALGKAPLARQSAIQALRLTLTAPPGGPAAERPSFAPNPADLLTALAGESLDADTAALVAAAGLAQPPPKSSP